MRKNVKRNHDSTIELEVELSPEEMRPWLLAAAEDLSREKPIEGFRPGKAPYDIVAKHVGELKVYERALSNAINAVVPKVLSEEGAQIVGRPAVSVKKIAPGNPAVFSLTAAILPEFQLPDVEAIAKKIVKERKNVEVGTNEVDETLRWLADARAEVKEVERPAQKGDAVEIDFTATLDQKEIGGGPSKNHPLTIGEGTMIPGFEEKLIGMRAGEEKTFLLLVPENHKEPDIAGKNLDFQVRMARIQERTAPELNDAFAKTVGNFENLIALRANIAEGILKEKEAKERDRIRVAIGEAVAEKANIRVPDVMTEQELEKMLSELRENITSMKLKYEDYLAHIKKSEDELKKEWRDDAMRRVKIALILRAVAKTYHIEPNEDEVQETVNRLFIRFSSPKEAKKQIDLAALRSYARGIVRNEAVFRWLENLEL